VCSVDFIRKPHFGRGCIHGKLKRGMPSSGVLLYVIRVECVEYREWSAGRGEGVGIFVNPHFGREYIQRKLILERTSDGTLYYLIGVIPHRVREDT